MRIYKYVITKTMPLTIFNFMEIVLTALLYDKDYNVESALQSLYSPCDNRDIHIESKNHFTNLCLFSRWRLRLRISSFDLLPIKQMVVPTIWKVLCYHTDLTSLHSSVLYLLHDIMQRLSMRHYIDIIGVLFEYQYCELTSSIRFSEHKFQLLLFATLDTNSLSQEYRCIIPTYIKSF